MSDVLGFLLTNRSIVTDDFARDEQAAAATRETMTRFLLAELSMLPIASPASGFTYRLEPAFGADVRSSASFGPFFLQRSLTVGEGQTSFTLSLQRAGFASIDGRPLGDGTLVATGWWLALLLFAAAAPASAQTFPKFTGFVVDAANVLPPDVEAALTAKLDALQKDTHRQLIVATIPDMQGYPLEDYGYKLGRAWGVGLNDVNNGIILFIAPNEPAGHRGPRIEVGKAGPAL